jgi:hypothetical protein
MNLYYSKYYKYKNKYLQLKGGSNASDVDNDPFAGWEDYKPEPEKENINLPILTDEELVILKKDIVSYSRDILQYDTVIQVSEDPLIFEHFESPSIGTVDYYKYLENGCDTQKHIKIRLTKSHEISKYKPYEYELSNLNNVKHNLIKEEIKPILERLAKLSLDRFFNHFNNMYINALIYIRFIKYKFPKLKYEEFINNIMVVCIRRTKDKTLTDKHKEELFKYYSSLGGYNSQFKEIRLVYYQFKLYILNDKIPIRELPVEELPVEELPIINVDEIDKKYKKLN